MKNGRLVVLDDVAHLAPAESPDEVARLIREHAAGEPPADPSPTVAEVREAGMAVRREVLGDAHVDRAIAGTTELTADFQDFITQYAWGSVWTRPGLDRRSRSLITLTALVARGHHEELAMHLRAARTNGLTNDEIKELLLQTAIYCGVPDANTAFRIAQDVLAEIDQETSMTSAHLYAASRTPFGRFGGALSGVRPDDLAATALSGVLAKAPGLDPTAIGDVFWGNANGAGEDNRNVGRMAVLLAGLPTSVPATTVNRLCGSSLDAAMMASRAIETGDADVVVAGGVESMTRAPWVLPKPVARLPGRRRHGGLDDAGLAAGQRPDAEGVDGLARRVQRAAAGRGSASAASGRTRSPPARTSSPTPPGPPGSTTTSSSPVEGVELDARRGDPARHHAREAGRR